MANVTPKEMLDTRATFHRIWTAAVGSQGYDKKAWANVMRVMDRAFDMIMNQESPGHARWITIAEDLVKEGSGDKPVDSTFCSP